MPKNLPDHCSKLGEKIVQHSRGTYGIYLKFNKGRINNWLDLGTLGFLTDYVLKKKSKRWLMIAKFGDWIKMKLKNDFEVHEANMFMGLEVHQDGVKPT